MRAPEPRNDHLAVLRTAVLRAACGHVGFLRRWGRVRLGHPTDCRSEPTIAAGQHKGHRPQRACASVSGNTAQGSQRRQMICLSNRPITRLRPMGIGTAASSERCQAGGGCSREETKEVSEEGEDDVAALMPQG